MENSYVAYWKEQRRKNLIFGRNIIFLMIMNLGGLLILIVRYS